MSHLSYPPEYEARSDEELIDVVERSARNIAEWNDRHPEAEQAWVQLFPETALRLVAIARGNRHDEI